MDWLSSCLRRRGARGAVVALSLLLFSCAHPGSPPPASAPLPPQAAAPPAQREYRIQQGDSLEVKFYYHQDLSQTVVVRPDGCISLQLIGEVKAADLSMSELQRLLLQRYAVHLRDPDISVALGKTVERRVYIGGEVASPGVIPHVEGLTCLQAIFAAGGAKRTGQLDSVVILRDQGTPQPLFLRLDFSDTLEGTAPGGDPLLSPNDIVFVPKSTIARLNDFVDMYIEQLLPIQVGFGFTYELNTAW